MLLNNQIDQLSFLKTIVGGGNVKIESKKLEFKVGPRIEAKNDAYQPKGGDKKVKILFRRP